MNKVSGDLEVHEVAALAVARSVSGDVEARSVATLQIEDIGGDCAIHDAQRITLGDVGGDSIIKDVVEALSYGAIGGDLVAQGSGQLDVSGGSVGGSGGPAPLYGAPAAGFSGVPLYGAAPAD